MAPADLRTLLEQAVAQHRAGQLDQAEALYGQVLAVLPQQFDALHLLGLLRHQRGDRDAAARLFERAAALRPHDPHLLNHRANLLRETGRLHEALRACDEALRAAPGHVQAQNNRGNVLLDLGRAHDALAAYDRAIALATAPPAASADLAALNANRGSALLALQQPGQALAAFDAALALAPAHAAAQINRAVALGELGREAASCEAFARALEQAPGTPLLHGQWLHAKLKLCDWRGLDAAFERLLQGIASDEPVSAPFPVLLSPATPAQQLRCATTFVRRHWPGAARWQPPHAADAKDATDAKGSVPLRIGYFSPDFHDHATARLLAGVIEAHRRDRVEPIAFAFGPRREDAMRARLRSAFAAFHEVSASTDGEIAGLARREGIRIAVDLAGFTRHSRTGIFAQRAAPLQAAWLGYPGSMGAPFIDYLIADRTVLPADELAHVSEQPVWLPHAYQPNDRCRAIAARGFTRAELGLRDDAFVFCCFNQSAKILPASFDAWMRLLRAVPGSQLWLLDSAASANLRAAAQTRGVEPSRLVFAPRWPVAEHLARHRAADLFLDTLPYNAHTTASDALWAGLPVLTQLGDSFAGRVGASLLRAAGLPELVTTTLADYEALALRLATDRPLLDGLRQRLAGQRDSCPLFDTAAQARALEAAYAAMWQRHVAGLPPAPLSI